MARNKTLDQLLKRAERQGFIVEQRRAGHRKITCPDGAPVFCPWSGGGGRGVKNLESTLRRHGFTP